MNLNTTSDAIKSEYPSKKPIEPSLMTVVYEPVVKVDESPPYKRFRTSHIYTV